MRLFAKSDIRMGYVDGLTPELSTAVFKEFRGMKISTMLMKCLLEEFKNRHFDISLRKKGHSITMASGRSKRTAISKVEKGQ